MGVRSIGVVYGNVSLFVKKCVSLLKKAKNSFFMANSPPHIVIGRHAKMRHIVVGSQSITAEIV